MPGLDDDAPKTPRWPLQAAGVLGFLGVALGAAGSHAIKPRLDAESYERFTTALHYHQLHAVALLALGLAAHVAPPALHTPIARAAFFFLLGSLLFSGSLYLHALTGIALPYLAPTGGFLLMFGWLTLLCRCWRK